MLGRARTAWRQLGVRPVPLPFEADTSLAKEREDDPEGFLEATDAVIEREVERLELRFVPATAEPEHQPSAADLVELGGHLGGERRIAERDREHQWTDLHPAGECRHRRQDGPGLVDAFGRATLAEEHVVRQVDRVEAALLGGERHVAQRGPRWDVTTRFVLAHRQHQPDLHRLATFGRA